MKVSDLMAKLAAMFPNSYPSREGMTAWTEIARPVLGHLEGMKLDRAFEACMATWDKPFAPKPAEIAKHAPEKPRPMTGSPGTNMRLADATYRTLKPRMIRAWLEANRARLEALPSGARWLCRDRMQSRAHDAALYEAMFNKPSPLQWSEDDWRLYENWKPLAEATARVGTLKPLPTVTLRDGPSETAPDAAPLLPAAPPEVTEEPLY